MKGSHRQFQHPASDKTITVAGKRSIDVPFGTLNVILKQAGLKKIGGNMRFLVVVEEGPESCGAYVPDLPGCIAVGTSRQETLALMQEAIALHLEDLKARGQTIPMPTSSVETVEVEMA